MQYSSTVLIIIGTRIIYTSTLCMWGPVYTCTYMYIHVHVHVQRHRCRSIIIMLQTSSLLYKGHSDSQLHMIQKFNSIHVQVPNHFYTLFGKIIIVTKVSFSLVNYCLLPLFAEGRQRIQKMVKFIFWHTQLYYNYNYTWHTIASYTVHVRT